MKIFNVVLFLLVLGFAGAYYFWYMPNIAELDRLSAQNGDGVQNLNETRLNDEDCIDCEGGSAWLKAEYRCENGVMNSTAFKNCLVTNGWGEMTSDTPLADIFEGYAELDGSKVSTEQFENGSKVFIYDCWAADEKGNLYTFDGSY